jgi:hypothetical protein
MGNKLCLAGCIHCTVILATSHKHTYDNQLLFLSKADMLLMCPPLTLKLMTIFHYSRYKHLGHPILLHLHFSWPKIEDNMWDVCTEEE